MNIILCGLPSVGKTSVGRLLAEKFSYTFIDTDEQVIQKYKAIKGETSTCREIVSEHGLKEFRKLEQEVIFELKYKEKCLIATGGGTLESQDNIYVLQYMGNILYLRGQPEIILSRLLKSGIPPYLDENNPVDSFNKLAEKRSLLFEQTFSSVIDTEDLTPEEIAEKAFTYYHKKDIFLL